MQEEPRACSERDCHHAGTWIVKNDNAAPAYMLTNLVDATRTLQIIDIHRYMMESIPIILQPSSTSDGLEISPQV